MRVMGIVNVTPDSFSDGGLYLDPGKAVEHGLELLESGAQVLDVGGESTRPGAAEVPADEEMAQVVPVIANPDELAARVDRLLARARTVGPVYLSFDPDGLLRLDDQILILSPTETELMALLIPRLGEVVTREELVAAVWPGQEGNLRLLNRHLVNLRKRLRGLPLAIHTVRTHGILLDKVVP